MYSQETFQNICIQFNTILDNPRDTLTYIDELADAGNTFKTRLYSLALHENMGEYYNLIRQEYDLVNIIFNKLLRFQPILFSTIFGRMFGYNEQMTVVEQYELVDLMRNSVNI